MPRPFLVLLVLLISFGVPAVAVAQGSADLRASSDAGVPSGPGPGDRDPAEIAALEAEIARAYETLSTENCTVACRALASMQKAADRLCALDDGPSCATARAKVREAEDRVRAACPECATAAGSAPPPLRAAATPTSESVAVVAKGRGGCAGCAVGGEGGGAATAAALTSAWMLARWLRRRRGVAPRRR